MSAVPAIHPSVVSNYLVGTYTNLFVNRCLCPLMPILGWMDTNGAPWFKWPEFFSAIVVIEGLFVLLSMKKLGSGVKFRLCQESASGRQECFGTAAKETLRWRCS